MPKQTVLISSAGLFPLPCCITAEETGLAAAEGMSAFQAGCFMPQRFPFLMFLMPTFAKLEWANTCYYLQWQQCLHKSIMEAIWKYIRAKNNALSGFACDAAGEFGSSANLACGRLPSILLLLFSVRCHCRAAATHQRSLML